MLPRSYNSGYHNDIRGFKKKNKPWKVYQQIAPFLAPALVLLLLLVGIVLNGNVKHGKTVIARLEASHRSKEGDIRGLANSLDQERKSRISAENGLREANSQLASSKRELAHLKESHDGKDKHTISLQESFDVTRKDLESQRDTAKLELEESKRRILRLETEASHKDTMLGAHRTVANRKEELFTSKEKEWEELRAKLEEQIRKGGGYIPQSPPPGMPVAHPDYSASEGKSGFHFTSDGHRERYLDTAKDLFHVGVEDPDGVEHLAAVMGHLMEIKQAEYAAIQKAYPAANPPPKPPIGHWMALNLERMGIKVPHGTTHLAYFLDAHFALDNNPDLLGRSAETVADNTGGANKANNSNAAQQEHPAVHANTNVPDGQQAQVHQAQGVPGIVNSPVPPPTAGQPDLTDPRLTMGRRHKVDSAGFI